MSADKLVHPDRDRLAAFGLGRLDDAASAALELHLADCEACRALVEALPADSFVSILQASVALTDPDVTGNHGPCETPTRTHGASATMQAEVPAELAGHARYRVLELLGTGGMGVVYKVEHRLMERPVALKVISRGLIDKPAAVERFRREVKAAARLSHPNIVTAYDAEQAGDAHFLVMEYVEGISLARLVAEQGPLPVVLACDYIRQAALGLQHAHEKGMVHRDIKPQNLMVTQVSSLARSASEGHRDPSLALRAGEGIIKILDFGLARFALESAPAGALAQAEDVPRLRGDSKPGESLTQAGTVIGTPDYIAPEQALDAHTADIRADIYSVGCTLYDLLAGHAPFPEGTAVQKVMAHAQRVPKPLTELRRDVPAELARVVERMMAKDPAKRYQTPAEVAAALAPFAAPAAQRRRRWLRWAAAAVLLVGLGLAGYFFGADIHRLVANKGRLRLESDVSDVQVILLRGGEKVRTIDLQTETQIDIDAGEYELQVAGERDDLHLSGNRIWLSRNGLVTVTVRRMAPEWGPFEGHEAGVRCVTFSPDGRHVLSGSDDKTLRLWDAETGKELRRFTGHEDAVVAVAFTPDGTHALSAGADKTLRLWEVETGKELRRFDGHEKPIASMALSPDGRYALSGGWEEPLRLWDMETGKEVRRFDKIPQEESTTGLAFSPDGKWAASCSPRSERVRLWEIATGMEIDVALVGTGVSCVAFSQDGQRVVVGTKGGMLIETQVKLGLNLQLQVNPDGIASLALSPDGRRALMGGYNGTLRLWDLRKAREVHSFAGHMDGINGLAISPDGRRAVSGSRDKTLRLWQLPEQVKVRNPFGFDEDVPGADDDDARAFAKAANLPGKPDDANAAPWVPQATDGKPDSLDGEWYGRWNSGSGAEFQGPMTATIKTVGDRVYIFTGGYLIEARREKDLLIGKYISSAGGSGTPWAGRVVDPERIDGQWTATGGRWDFRRKLK